MWHGDALRRLLHEIEKDKLSDEILKERIPTLYQNDIHSLVNSLLSESGVSNKFSQHWITLDWASEITTNFVIDELTHAIWRSSIIHSDISLLAESLQDKINNIGQW